MNENAQGGMRKCKREIRMMEKSGAGGIIPVIWLGVIVTRLPKKSISVNEGSSANTLLPPLPLPLSPTLSR